MRYFISPIIICLVLLISLCGFSLADSLPTSIIYIQGGENDITSESNGTFEITIHDVIPYYHILIKNTSYLESIQTLPDYSYPLQAVFVSSDDNNESRSMVIVENVTISDENKTLILQIKPLEFYEGSVLKTFADGSKGLDTDSGRQVMSTGLYLEIIGSPSNNMDVKDCLIECKTRGTSPGLCWKMCEYQFINPIPLPR